MKTLACVAFLCLFVMLCHGTFALAGTETIEFQLRTLDADGQYRITTKQYDPKKVAVVVVDMWGQGGHGYLRPDGTFDGTAEGYLYQEWVTKEINHTLAAARALGMQIVYTPAGMAKFYENHIVRRNIKAIPRHDHPWKSIGWNKDQEKIPFSEFRGEYEYRYPGMGWERRRPGTKSYGQNPNLFLCDTDMLTDNTDELWNLIQERELELLIYMGGSTNMCLAGRPFGLLNMKKYGVNVVMDRNYEHVIHRIPHGWNGDIENPKFGPQYTNERNSRIVIDYFEKNICSTIDGMVLRGMAEKLAGGYQAPQAAVKEAVVDREHIKINFSPQHIEVPEGFVIDCGWEYVKHPNGLTYGWDSSHVLEATRTAYDPLNSTYCKVKPGSKWHIELEQGRYLVKVCLEAGQGGNDAVNVEGVSLCAKAQIERQPEVFAKTVHVRDGQLTIDFGNSADCETLIVYLELVRK